MATHSSTLARRIPWTEQPGGLHPWGQQESDTSEGLTHTHTHSLIQKGGEEMRKRIRNASFHKMDEVLVLIHSCVYQ